MKLMRWFLVLIGVGLLSGCGSNGGNPGMTDPGSPPATASISGTVTYKGLPMAGATVYAWSTNTNVILQTTTTDANGNYTVKGLGDTADVPQEYQFWAIKAGYGFYPSVGSGATVMRAGMNGQFEGLNTLNPPIIFTVIDWIPAQGYGGTFTGANFQAYDGSNPRVNIAASGQSASYAGGDDGALRTGTAWPGTRFTDNQDGTVTDHLTGLIWLKNAGCFNPTNWDGAFTDVNTLSSGQCGLADASTAGTWRLPNLHELESLVDVSASNPALTAGNPFVNVSGGLYWTATPYYGGILGSFEAWVIRLSDGSYVNDEVSNVMATSNNAVWAVKGTSAGAVALPATGFIVSYQKDDDGALQMGVRLTYPRWLDNGNGTITDTMTGLIWLKQANCINQPWAGALAAISHLASGQCGLTDGSTAGSWRMPNRNEIQSMSDRMQTNEADYFDYTILNLDYTVYQPPIFANFVSSQFYWTSTTDAANTGEAWTVYSCDFGVYGQSKANTGYTLAVR
jgi:hypothetical protein